MIVYFVRILHKEFSIFFSEQCEKSLVCSKVLYISMLEEILIMSNYTSTLHFNFIHKVSMLH